MHAKSTLQYKNACVYVLSCMCMKYLWKVPRNRGTSWVPPGLGGGSWEGLSLPTLPHARIIQSMLTCKGILKVPVELVLASCLTPTQLPGNCNEGLGDDRALGSGQSPCPGKSVAASEKPSWTLLPASIYHSFKSRTSDTVCKDSGQNENIGPGFKINDEIQIDNSRAPNPAQGLVHSSCSIHAL